MFCHKCGTQSLEDASFCQKCGARLIANEPTAEEEVSAAVPSFVQSITAPQTIINPVPTAVKDANAISSEEAYELLKGSMTCCPKIKSVALTKSGVKAKGLFYNYQYIINAATGKASLLVSSALLSTILFALDAIICSWFGWELQENGFDSLSMPLAICLIASGIIGVIVAFFAYKEMRIIMPHIYHTLESHNAALPPIGKGLPKSWQFIVSMVINAVFVIIGMVVMITNISDNWDSSGFYNDGNEASGYSTPSPFPSTSSGGNVSLDRTYTNDEEGFSLSYPSTWIVMENDELRQYQDTDSIVGLFARYDDETNSSGFEAKIFVDKSIQTKSYTATESDFQEMLSGFLKDVVIIDLSDMELDGVYARKIVYSYEDGGNSYVLTRCFYMIGADMYDVSCLSLQDYYEKYAQVFDSIMDSYIISREADNPGSTVLSVNEATPATVQSGELLYKGIPVYELLHVSTLYLIDTFGSDFEYDWWEGSDYYDYNDVTFFLNELGEVTYIWLDPVACEVDGVTLDMNRSELISVLGEPAWEGWSDNEDDDIYMMQYYDSCLVVFEMSDPSEKAYMIAVQ